MMGLLLTLYLCGIVATFIGAAYLPRWRVLLVTLGVVAILVPVAGIAAIVIEFARHPPDRMGF